VDRDVERRFNQGCEWLKQERFEEAIQDLQAVVTAAPDHWRAHYHLGWAYAHHGDIGRAAESFGQAVALQSHSAHALNGRGSTLGELGHHELAVATIRRAITLTPDVATFHAHLGLNLDRLGQHEEAMAALREAIRLDPNLLHAQMNLGAVLLDQARFQEALDVFANICRVDAVSAHARRGLARALTGLGRYAEAQQALQQAITLRPEDAALHAELGSVLEQQRHWAFALHEYRRSCPFRPDIVDLRGGREVVFVNRRTVNAVRARAFVEPIRQALRLHAGGSGDPVMALSARQRRSGPPRSGS
jgi:Flp pilus assembly protein TadD